MFNFSRSNRSNQLTPPAVRVAPDVSYDTFIDPYTLSWAADDIKDLASSLGKLDAAWVLHYRFNPQTHSLWPLEYLIRAVQAWTAVCSAAHPDIPLDGHICNSSGLIADAKRHQVARNAGIPTDYTDEYWLRRLVSHLGCLSKSLQGLARSYRLGPKLSAMVTNVAAIITIGWSLVGDRYARVEPLSASLVALENMIWEQNHAA